MKDKENIARFRDNRRIKLDKRSKGYTDIDNYLIQTPFKNSKLSKNSVLVIWYLHSLPSDWQPYADQIQDHFDFGRDAWERVSRELRDAGFLRSHRGGVGGGEYLEFSYYKFSVDNSEERCPEFQGTERRPEKPAPEKPGRHIQSNNHIQSTKCSLYKHKHRDYDYLESELGVKLKSWGWYPHKIVKEIKTHGFDVLYYQIGLLKERNEKTPIRDWGAALTDELKRL